MGIILLAAVTHAAAPVGLAQSEKGFAVDREAASLQAAAATPFLIKPGDHVKSADGLVRIDGSKGETVLLGNDSTVEVTSQDRLRLNHGEMAVSLPKDRQVSLDVADLTVAPLEADKAAAGGYAIQKLSDDSISVLSTGRMVQVEDNTAGKSLATLGDGDSVRLVKGQGGWFPTGPINPLADFSADPTEDENGTNRKKGGLFGLLNGAGSGGVAAGGVAGTGAVVAGGAIATGGVAAGTIALTSGTRETTSPMWPDPTPPPTPVPEER